jgi:hypothetical protein
MKKLMEILKQSNKENKDKFAWPFALLIVALLVVTEALPYIFGMGDNAKWDWSFLYVTIRFVLLPVACIAHVGINFYQIIKSIKEKLQIIQFSSVIVSIGYLISLYFHPLPLTVWK